MRNQHSILNPIFELGSICMISSQRVHALITIARWQKMVFSQHLVSAIIMLARLHYYGHGRSGGVKGVCAVGGAHIYVCVCVCW